MRYIITKSHWHRTSGLSIFRIGLRNYPFTMKAWIIPGIQAKAVSMTLIKNVVPKPWVIKTAKGGKRILRIIVTNDIICGFKFINYSDNRKLVRIRLLLKVYYTCFLTIFPRLVLSSVTSKL